MRVDGAEAKVTKRLLVQICEKSTNTKKLMPFVVKFPLPVFPHPKMNHLVRAHVAFEGLVQSII